MSSQRLQNYTPIYTHTPSNSIKIEQMHMGGKNPTPKESFFVELQTSLILHIISVYKISKRRMFPVWPFYHHSPMRVTRGCLAGWPAVWHRLLTILLNIFCRL